MAEFCLKCFNEINEFSLNRFDVILSWDLDLCEHCGKYKRVVTGFRPSGEIKIEEYFNEENRDR